MIATEIKSLRIVVSEYKSLRDWCDLLSCEEGDLLNAVYAVGTSVQAVDDFLVLNRRKRSNSAEVLVHENNN